MMVFPGTKFVPSVVATRMRSLDSSEWKVPLVPSAQELLMVLGWLGSAPPERVSLPSRSDGPESQAEPRVPHFRALSVES